ncbi:MAG: hypothetical protein A2751_01825 [Candidatus Doudnabacteria bacterium RIFCSPHIGHO2_01_FULL_46_14]|uniref:Zinc finger DksA/TraR C4-type domain-containing protein n=1 Tax=Candidatus Doudnabacteria bacterium RIFCSPHIGHO2_01_FULL_46_14 TaxID=1817824 RepID=A0A1F5NK31_9BACT|nr:MAG: hypothetical protein A2751_01825 [Candidatus Doudnabacteria bacterium RIFCSPHIGHO2_01_FULL_46_14]
MEKNKKLLEQERTRLQSLLARVEDKDGQPKYPDFGNSEEDNAAEVAAYETNIAEEHDLEPKLNRVIAALQRIDNGSYGLCKVGGEEIPEARLAAVPEAENCVAHDKAE